MSLLSFDIGSSHCKGVLFSEHGEVLAERSYAFTPDFPQPSFAEVNPNTFWTALCTLSNALVTDSSRDPTQALSLSSHGETFIPCSSEGHPIGPAILNIDNRAASEAAWLEERFGRAKLFRITGQAVHAIYSIPKILWLKRNRPDIWKMTHSFLSVPAYLLKRMGMPAYIDYSLAGRFLAFDIRTHQWSPEILTAVDLTPAVLPLPVPAGTIAGKLDSDTASRLGVPSGTPVVLGGHDQACGALGNGVIEAGRASNSMGTYECILTASDEPQLGDMALAAGLNSAFHVVPEKYTTLAYFPAGIMLQWFHDLIYGDTHDSPDGHEEADHFSQLESVAPRGPSGLYITPHLIGTCNPDFNPRARAAIAGLFAGASRGHIYKGILEGIACELLQITEDMTAAVGNFQDFYVVGGGSRSHLGIELRASITQRRFHLMKCQESVCLGGAILAAIALGIYHNAPEAVSNMVHERFVVEPRQELAAQYSQQAKQYRALCKALEDVREECAQPLVKGETQ
jgi:xylulokinase